MSKRKLLPILLSILLAWSLPNFLIPSAQATVTLNDYYITGDDNGYYLHAGSANWMGQTFTTSATYYVTKIGLKGWSLNTQVGTLTVSVRATSGGLPTGSDLTTGTLNLATANHTTPGSWHNITMTTSVVLSSSMTYAIIAHATGSSNDWIWREDITSSNYTGGNRVGSPDSGASWGAVSAVDFLFKVYGELGYNFIFKGVYWENTGLLKTASQRAVNVTAHFKDGTTNAVFEVNGTYNYSTINDVQYFSYNITGSTSISDYVVSQYGLNLYVYNGSEYYYVLFANIEEDTDYELNVTATWSTTTTVATKTTTGANVTFGTPPINLTSTYLNYYVYRTSTTSSQTERTREYWISSNEDYGGTIYIFDGDFTTYSVTFQDLAGILTQYPYVAAKRYINGSQMIVEQKKVDENNLVTFNLINGKRYTLTIENSQTVYTFGDIQTTSDTTLELLINGLAFPENIVLAYTKVHMYADRSFGGTYLNFYYEDLTSNTASVTITVYDSSDTSVYNSTQTSQAFSVSWTSADTNTTYYALMRATHATYGVLDYRITFPRGYTTNPWSFAWLGSMPGNVDINSLFSFFIILCAFGVFSQKNAYVGMFLAICLAGLLTWIGWMNISWTMIVVALCFTILYALGRKRRPVFGE